MDKFLALMAKLRISAVYWVDDENAEGAELDINKLSDAFLDGLIGAGPADAKLALSSFLRDPALRHGANQLLSIANAEEEDADSKFSRMVPILEPLVENMEDPIGTLVEGLKRVPGPLRGAERDALISLFRQDGHTHWAWKPLSFTKWGQEGKKVLDSHNPEQPVLFVIDLQNASEGTAANGSSVLTEIAAAALDRKSCHLIVLTSECKTEEEFKRGRKLTEDFFTTAPDKRLPVFAMSKNRFSVKEDEISKLMASAFSNVLERADLSLTHLDFAEIMREHFVKSIEITFNALDRVTIEELMYAVTHTSREEGVSEIETLVRLMNIAQRESFQQAIVDSEKLRSTILTLRASELSLDRAQLESDKEIVKLRSAELYDKPEVINKLYSALSPGDLFIVTSRAHPTIAVAPNEAIGTDAVGEIADEAPVPKTQLYVLVANACDLMLRSDGERHLETGILLRLDEPSKGEGLFRFQLPHLEFTKVPDASLRQIELRRYTSVSLAVLDLCWTNPGGECVWSPDGHAAIQDKLLGSQLSRLNNLNSEFPNMNNEELCGLISSIKAQHSTNRTDDGQLTEVKFEIRRVGRLSHAHAAQLNSRFTSVFGRPSADHDFSKQA